MNWKPVVGYEGKYEVSDCGAVRKIGGVDIGQWSNDSGYSIVRLSGPRSMKRVHRLVAEAFIPNPECLPFVNHLDANTSNNHASNLEWCTAKGNIQHCVSLGRIAKNAIGLRPANAKLSDAEVSRIREEYANGGTSFAKLGDKYGVSKWAIGSIISGENYNGTRTRNLPPPPQGKETK